MAGNISSNEDEGVTGINIIPLVDIMLVLLIIFMVTATVQSAKSIPVQVPKASTGAGGASTAIDLSLDKAGSLHLDGRLVDYPAAQRLLRESVRRDSTIQVLISADDALGYSKVVWVLDMVRASGIGRYALKVKAAGTQGT
jgi:biopolymer transport protein ExbD